MSEHQFPDSAEDPAPGAIVLGVPWDCPENLVLTAASLASTLDVHLVCAFVDPATHLVEWGPPSELLGASLDPVVNEEAVYPAKEVFSRLQTFLGSAQPGWSFRLLNGSIAPALCRLADSVGACMIIVGGQRRGVLARLGRAVEGSVAVALERSQHRPVVVIPLYGHRHRVDPKRVLRGLGD